MEQSISWVLTLLMHGYDDFTFGEKYNTCQVSSELDELCLNVIRNGQIVTVKPWL